MRNKFLKFFLVFIVIFGLSFSNIPFYVLSGAINSYIAGLNIVDKAWNLSRDKNVVDKFASYRNLAERVKIQEARAAVSYIGNSNYITTNGSAPGAITPNASTIDGDLLVFFHYSRATGGNETVTPPAGFTPLFNSVTANQGLVAVAWRIKQSGDSSFTASVTNHTSGTSGETILEWISTYQGFDSSNPIVNYTPSLSTWTSSLNIGPISAPATATVNDGDVVVVFGGRFENVNGQTTLAGDNLTWSQGARASTNLGSDAGAVTQNGLNSTGSNQTATAKTITTTGTAQVGAGRMFIIEKELSSLAVSTSGTQTTALNSGAADQHIGGGATAAFRLQMSSAADAVTNVKITETGNVELADLTNLRLYYESASTCGYNGTESNVTASPAGETVTFNLGGTAVPISPNYLCLYLVFDVDGGATGTKGGQTIDVEISNPSTDVTIGSGQNTDTAAKAISGSTTILPDATNVTYGSGLSDGGRSGEAITVSGYGFGAAPGGSRGNCSGAVDTGCVRFTVGGAATVADANVTAWSNTSITFTIAAGLNSEGGTSGMEVVAGGQTSAGALTFFIYPNITAVAVCSGCNTNSAREHAAGTDTDGLIMLSGDHFGSAGSATVLGSSATQHGTAEGACTSSGYSSTTVCLEIPTAISDSLYTGNIVLTRTSDSKTHTSSNFRILPRIISNTPSASTVGSTVQMLGNHFCESGTCPISPNRSTAGDNVKFGSTQALDADFQNLSGGAGACNGTGAAWTHSEICVNVPAGTSPGSAPTAVKSNTSYTSNSETFTVQSTIPNDPANLDQFESTGVTALSVGSSTNVSSVVLRADISSSLSINMAIQVEATTTANSFGCSGSGACSYAVQGTVAGGGACTSCTSLNNASTSVTNLPDGTYHWQMRVRNTATNEYSNWVSFGGNPESATDFKIDTSGPTITFPNGDTCAGAVSNLGTNSAQIDWSLNETADGQAEYGANSDLSGSSLNPASPLAPSLSHTVTLSNLNSGTTYYFKAKSRDTSNNLATRPQVQPFCSFTTGSVSQPGKTTAFYVVGSTSTVAGASTLNSVFSVPVPETSPSVQSSFVEITASSGGGTNNFQVQVNGQTATTYVIDTTPTGTFFKVLYPVFTGNLNLDTGNNATNSLQITPSINTDVSSAKIIVLYSYTP